LPFVSVRIFWLIGSPGSSAGTCGPVLIP